MKIRKILVLTLCVILSAGLMYGCNSSAENTLPTNEVITTIPYDTEKENLVISVSDGLDYMKCKTVLAEKFPDVNIIMRNGMNTESSVLGGTADIYLVPSTTIAPEVEEKLLDLSAFDSTSNYYT